jgi:hypothetical protein
MMDYEAKAEKNQKRNGKFINEFKSWLEEKKYTERTIRKHLNNIELYINDYLNYYDIVKMEDGMLSVYSFLGGWFIEKCSWASISAVKEMAASIKKFYQCMCEKNYVNEDDFRSLCNIINDNMDYFCDCVEKYYDDFDDFM